MQVVTPEFVAALLAPQAEAVEVAGVRYRADIGARPPVLREEGPGGARDYPLAHALGGKNVFYFLTPIERGRLQVVPLAFDVAGKQWFDATASMVRHASEVPVDWRDPLLTFNTSCHGCHVSQLSTNYDEASDSYRTTWAEPGIGCETCHNAAGEHVRIFREAARSGAKPEDPALLRYKGLDPESVHRDLRPLPRQVQRPQRATTAPARSSSTTSPSSPSRTRTSTPTAVTGGRTTPTPAGS